MADYQSTGIQIHLVTGHKRMFYQEDVDLVARICNDMDGRIFSRASLIIDSADDVTAIPGSAMLGITILTEPLPPAFYESEKQSKTVITQISQEAFQFRRLQNMSKVEGRRSPVLCELEFASRERLFLEFSEVALSGMAERNVMHHLFSRPSLSCRRLDGGFSIWNTAHIVSWSFYPKLDVPANAWPAEAIVEHISGEARIVNMP